MLVDELIQIAKDRKHFSERLAMASKPARDVIHWCYGPFDIDLPMFDPRDIGDMPRSEISQFGPRADILRQESSKLLTLFSKQHNPDLNRERRIKVFRDILGRCTDRARVLLLEIVRDRRIGNLTREDVAGVYGEEFFAWRSLPTPPTPSRTPFPQQRPKQTGKDLFEPFAPLKIIGIPEI
jgi:hypothetical protein